MSRKPPKVTETTPIGPDVDLRRETVRTKSGNRVTGATVKEFVQTSRRRGRPGLGASGAAPTVAFRLAPDLRRRAEVLAAREGKTVSALAREALEARIQGPRGGARKSTAAKSASKSTVRRTRAGGPVAAKKTAARKVAKGSSRSRAGA